MHMPKAGTGAIAGTDAKVVSDTEITVTAPDATTAASNDPMTVTKSAGDNDIALVGRDVITITNKLDELNVISVEANRGVCAVSAPVDYTQTKAALPQKGVVPYPHELKFGEQLAITVSCSAIEFTVTTDQGAWTYSWE